MSPIRAEDAIFLEIGLPKTILVSSHCPFVLRSVRGLVRSADGCTSLLLRVTSREGGRWKDQRKAKEPERDKPSSATDQRTPPP